MNSVGSQDNQTDQRYSPTPVDSGNVGKNITEDTLSMSPMSSTETRTSNNTKVLRAEETDVENALPPRSNTTEENHHSTEGPSKEPQMEQAGAKSGPTMNTVEFDEKKSSFDRHEESFPPPEGRKIDSKPYEVIMHHDDMSYPPKSNVSGIESIGEEEPELKFPRLADREYVSIHNDVYNMFFLSHWGGHAFWYSFYIFSLKMALYTFLAIDVIRQGLPDPKAENPDDRVDPLVLAAQFLMLPVAVAMQEDITGTYFLIANIRYCESIKNENENADKTKFFISIVLRAIDGVYSLFVNYVVLISNTQVLGLFLNFAALQFLQTIDNIALEMAADGFLSERLEEVADNVQKAELPKRNDDHYLRAMDSIMFILTVLALLIFWICFATGVV